MVDILAIGAHPDDIELSCSGTLFKQVKKGYSVGLLDLCRGELGTRGTPELRIQEANAAAEILGARFRWNAELQDGFMNAFDRDAVCRVATFIRRAKPSVVIANAPEDRHPDHGRAADIAREACFVAGLKALDLKWEGKSLAPSRPRILLHYIQDRHLVPDIVVDISEFLDKKIEVVKAFKSQFYNPDSTEPETPISSKDFMDQLTGKAQTYGRYCGVTYGEGFILNRPAGIDDINELF